MFSLALRMNSRLRSDENQVACPSEFTGQAELAAEISDSFNTFPTDLLWFLKVSCFQRQLTRFTT